MSTQQSPFDSSPVIAMYLEPILNQYYKTYQNIITLSQIPQGPLEPMVAHINVPRLSEFQTLSAWSPPPTSRNSFSTTCIHALLRYPNTYPITNSVKNGHYYMYADDVPNVFGYLESNGYKIMTDLTTMTYKTKVDVGSQYPGGNRRLLCMFRYTG